MIVSLYVLAYLFIGWIVASVHFAISMYPKKKQAEIHSDFVVLSLLWPLVIIAFVLILIIYINLLIGRMIAIAISKLMKGKNK